MTDPANPDENPMKGWHLDKRVPLALIVALAIQTGTFGFWLGSVQSRVDELERRTQVNDEVRERLVRVETLLEGLVSRMDRRERDGERAQ